MAKHGHVMGDRSVSGVQCKLAGISQDSIGEKAFNVRMLHSDVAAAHLLTEWVEDDDSIR